MAASSSARDASAFGFATRIASLTRTSPTWRRPFITRVGPGRDEIDDRLREAEPRCHLDGARRSGRPRRRCPAPRRSAASCSGGRSRRAARPGPRWSGRRCPSGRQRPAGIGRSRGRGRAAGSAPDSLRRSTPVIPRSATPSPTNSMTSLVRTNRMSRSKFWTRATRLRSCSSKTSPASCSRLRVGSTRRPLFGTARRSRSLTSLVQHGPVAALAVVQPRGDPGDGRGAGARSASRSPRSAARHRAAGRPPTAATCRAAP